MSRRSWPKLNEALKSCGDFKCKSPASVSGRGAEASVQTTSAEGRTLGGTDASAIGTWGHRSTRRRELPSFDAGVSFAQILSTA